MPAKGLIAPEVLKPPVLPGDVGPATRVLELAPEPPLVLGMTVIPVLVPALMLVLMLVLVFVPALALLPPVAAEVVLLTVTELT